MTAKARYGLQALSGERNSTRVDSSLPGLTTGTLTRADRLLRAQETWIGASYPETSRLYELTHWLVTAVISPAWRRRPAMNPSATSESPPGRSVSTKALASSRKSERWVCMPEPCTPASGFGMKLANTPCWRAISLTTRRTVMTVSAMVRASV